MAKYVMLGNWTDQGIREVAKSPDRAQAVAKAAAEAGGRLVEVIYTMGAYDFVAIAEAPDDETITSIAVRVGAQGNVRTTTMRGYSTDEFRALIKRAGL